MTRLVLLLAVALSASLAAADTPVYVVGTLYRHHDDVPSYDLGELGRVIAAIDPQVLVLDVSPSELAARQVAPSKIEYPGVIFPYLRDRHRVYAGEPAEPMYGEIVKATIEAHKAFEAEHPEAAAALKGFSDATFASLHRHWTSAAKVNDAVTERVFAGKHALEGSLIGPVEADGWARWNQNVADVVRRAVAENPGKRVLVLTGIENRYAVDERLRGAKGIRLIDMERWLKERP